MGIDFIYSVKSRYALSRVYIYMGSSYTQYNFSRVTPFLDHWSPRDLMVKKTLLIYFQLGYYHSKTLIFLSQYSHCHPLLSHFLTFISQHYLKIWQNASALPCARFALSHLAIFLLVPKKKMGYHRTNGPTHPTPLSSLFIIFVFSSYHFLD
jgi:hypothetical protein